MMKTAALILLLSLLSACSSTTTIPVGADFNDKNVSKIKKHASTKSDITQLFGKPFQVSILGDGTETWTYFYQVASGTASAFSSNTKTSVSQKKLIVTFLNGKVDKFGYHYIPNR